MGWLERRFSGHWSCGPFTFYGYNAMHFAVQFHTRRWGYICFAPPVKLWGGWWPWKFYASHNATPWAATFAMGPGIELEAKLAARLRRHHLGHGFDSEVLSYDQMQPPFAIDAAKGRR